MISTPTELYRAILAFKSDIKSAICHLHIPCKGHPLCSEESQTEVLDFDMVEKELAKGKRSTKPSCDGVTLSRDGSAFCFVEIKGWVKFVDYNISYNNTSISKEDRLKIKNKASEYNLKGKLEQSICDCEEIACQSNLFTIVPYVYIIVSDIEEEKDAAIDIAANLSSLANTATVWKICEESMIHQMKTIDVSVNKVFTHCRDFDTCLDNIHI